MPFYQFKHVQKINSSVEKVWDFMSSPRNLKVITPPYMGFDITSDNAESKMYEGMLISYRVSPILGVKTTWVTEITKVKDHHYFIDEQRVGPYKLWHHQHFIEATEKGVLMTDIVSYQPPFGFLGRIANQLFIKKKLKEIFDFRRKAVEEYFS